jgi:diaminopropionate ammonia-lyase
LLINPRIDRQSAYADKGRTRILSLAALEHARREITSWPGYEPTPLRALPGLARANGLGGIALKDEGGRFGLGSFKALGGAYAVLRIVQKEIERRAGRAASAAEISAARFRDITSGMTMTAATDGNHGRSVAWGARTFGCRCVIYMPETVSIGRVHAIESYGGKVRRLAGTYDDCVRQAAADAAREGWHVVSDTSYDDYVEVPRDVMQGYCLMVEEALSQSPETPTHVFVQAGVGGLAAAVCAYLWERLETTRPRYVLVEPDKADCFFRSAQTGRQARVDGALDTIMAGLASGEVALEAWEILSVGVDAFLTIGDEAAAETMRVLARPRYGDQPVVTGESGVAGLAGLLVAAADPEARRLLALDGASRILVFGTEGATDPEVYRDMVGLTPDHVLAMRTP